MDETNQQNTLQPVGNDGVSNSTTPIAPKTNGPSPVSLTMETTTGSTDVFGRATDPLGQRNIPTINPTPTPVTTAPPTGTPEIIPTLSANPTTLTPATNKTVIRPKIDWDKYYKETSPLHEQVSNLQSKVDDPDFIEKQKYPGSVKIVNEETPVSTQGIGRVFATPANGNISPNTTGAVQRIIRTYKNDVEEAIKYNHVSSIDMALAEQKRRQDQTEIMPRPAVDNGPVWKSVLLVFSLLLVLGGGGAVYYYYNYILKNSTTTTTDAKPVAGRVYGYQLIHVDSQEQIDLASIDKNKYTVVLKNKIETNSVKEGSIQEIYTSKNITTDQKVMINSAEFLKLLGMTLPDNLLRNLQSSYMFGLFSMDGNQPFLILKTTSFDNAFAGMLSWEANILNNFGKIFSIEYIYQNIVDTKATTSTDYFQGPKFKDTVIKNIDSKFVQDRYGRTVFIYSLPDKETIVITKNETTMREVITRLIAAKNVKL